MKLYIANTSKQRHTFTYRIESGALRYQDIEIGHQERIGGELDIEEIDKIVKQHIPYGLKSLADLKTTRDYVGLCYSIDKPINLDAFMTTFERNDRALNVRAEERREEAMAATKEMLERKVNLPVQRAEVEIIEETAGTPKIAIGMEVTAAGVDPRHAKAAKVAKSQRAQ